ncbi:MAG: PQQ-dependent sugar dehydrogenase [SAR324 cluster bacterium]|nr:PQQ-dependent sugar dehydrogenase [SAR324 cluster bacterium]
MKTIERGILIFLSLLALSFSALQAQGAKDWVAIKDHTVVLENTGWSFPVEIAFVPNPGSLPKDPLYYVSELRGTIKVVTNDRTVYTYAEKINSYRPPTELPNELAEVGLTGICLDSGKGYLFATTAYLKNSTFYNKIVRFEHETTRFAVNPKKSIEFTRIFDKDESTNSHQIGKCVIGKNGKLFVGVGDGHQHHKSQGLDNPNGKILRMNPDGSAPEDNPYYSGQNPESVSSYIFAYGLRNPFAITLDDDDQLYITDNGPDRDRLIEAVPGKNYLWDGTNDSMRGNSIWNWSGSVGPAGAIFLGAETKFPYWKHRILVAQGGAPQTPGPSQKGRVTINSFRVQAGRGLIDNPQTLVSFRGNYLQMLIPIAEGPDGIYFSGFFPDPQNQTSIFKLIREEGKIPDSKSLSGSELFHAKGCVGCHQITGFGGRAGPPLDGLIDRLQESLFSEKYDQQLEFVDQLTTPLHVKYQSTRAELRLLEGEKRIEYWLRHHLAEPRFDVQHSQMPQLGLSAEEIDQLTAYLLTLRNLQQAKLNQWEEWHRRFRVWWDTEYNARPLVGAFFGAIAVLLLQWMLRKILRFFKNKSLY